jgi:hypothetical protein
MATRALQNHVRRYTTLSRVLEVLEHRTLTLVEPSSWDDSNDVELLKLYEAHNNAASVLALCFTMSTETYHHWKIFAGKPFGVCLELRRAPLELSLNKVPRIVARPVEYLKVKDLSMFRKRDIARLPFVKREGYSDEREWRIVATHHGTNPRLQQVPIQLEWISRIILNPWLDEAEARRFRTKLRGVMDGLNIKIEASHLTSSEKWKAAARKLTSRPSTN